MRKLLLIALILLPALSLNLTVECSGNCIAYVPVAGHGFLNYTINGSKLGDVFRTGFSENFTGSAKNTLLRINLTAYSCETPAAAFVGFEPVESAYFDEFLLASANLSASNTTLKLFCSGYNTLRSQASWYGQGVLAKNSSSNITYNGNRTVVSGLDLLASKLFNAQEVELGRGNLSAANLTSQNVSFFDKNMQPLGDVELGNYSYVYMDFGMASNKYFYAVSHGNATVGNITMVNESLGVNATLQFNTTGGVAVADVDGDGIGEIVACANTTDYNVTVIEGGWNYYQVPIVCPFASFDSINLTGINESIVTFNSTSLVIIVFNTSVYVNSTPLAGITDIASFDVDGDGRDEVAVAFSNGDVRLYNVSLPLSIEQIDYLGNWTDTKIDAATELLIGNGTLGLYSKNPLAVSGTLSYKFPNSIPVKLGISFTTGGTGNVTLNASVGGWFYNKTWTSPTTFSLTAYPTGNGTSWVNFTLDAVNSTYEPWIIINNITVTFANPSFVNNTASTDFFSQKVPITINTSIHGKNFTIIGAKFRDAFYLEYFMAYLKTGNYSFELNGSGRIIDLWKPAVSASQSSYWIGGYGVQGSQSESDSLVSGFNGTLNILNQTNITAYGSVKDYCSLGEHIVYTWENATLFSWNGSLTEVGNITGNFSECWMTQDKLYLVNSTGAVEIYNYTPSKVGQFLNSSFVVRDVLVADKMYLWNGTDLANATGNNFTLIQKWSSELFYQQFNYVRKNTTQLSSSKGIDLQSDSLWEMVKGAVYSIIGGIAKLLEMVQGTLSSSANKISVAQGNGTLTVYDVGLNAPSTGKFTSFSSNASYSQTWIIVNGSWLFRVNTTVSDFIYNSTDTLNDFHMVCENSTYSQNLKMEKYSNNSFTVNMSVPGGKYSCEIYPKWETDLPTSFSVKRFTLYSDTQAPQINNATPKKYVSSNMDFNITINVTEDGLIKEFKVFPDKYTASISGFQKSGKLYILTVKLQGGTSFPYDTKLNISATDYTDRSSGNFTTANITVYDEAAPLITILDNSLTNNLQDFDTVPVNMSIRGDSSGDANLSYMNITVWDTSTLVTYSNATGINKDIYTHWLNKSLSGIPRDYLVKIYVEDITGKSNNKQINVRRFGAYTRTVNGKWWDTSSGDVEFTWTHTLTSTGVSDTDTMTNKSSLASFSIELKTPDIPVDEWYVKLNNSAENLKYVKLKYNGKTVSDVTTHTHEALNEYGLNVTDRPDTIFVRGERTVGISEKMCVNVCLSYDVSVGSCSGSWSQYTCGVADANSNTFTIPGSNSLINNYASGVGFKITNVAVTSTTTDTGTTTTTTTVTTGAGTAVVTITAPTSTTAKVNKCADVSFKIKNTGSIAASLSKITASGFAGEEMTFTRLSTTSLPYNLQPGVQLEQILSFCPLKVKTFNPSVCVKVDSTNKCVTTKIVGEGNATQGTTTEEIKTPTNLTVSVDTFEKEYIVFVNSSIGPVDGAKITITYPDGTIENYTTNVFGKVSFKPSKKDFTVKVKYGNETLTKDIEKIIEQKGLTIWRVLFDFLIVGALLAFGIILDEKMI